MVFVRPFGNILQWDDNACEAACTAQLMHVAGKLNLPFNTSHFDRLIGRQPGGFDETAGCFKLLLAKGFKVDVWNTGTYADTLQPQKFRTTLQHGGLAKDAIDEFMRSSYPRLRRRVESLVALTRHPRFNVHVVGQTTESQLESLLHSGAIVGAYLRDADGISHLVLLRSTSQPGVIHSTTQQEK